MKLILRTTLLLLLVGLSVASTISPFKDKYFEISKNLQIFASLYKELNTFYVDDLDPGRLMRTGIDAMVGSLDPYTNYISESDIEGYRFQVEGQYSGIGATSKVIGEYVTIIDLYRDQPADRAGLKIGDRILSINSLDARGKSVEEVNAVLQGTPDTRVTFRVERPGSKKPVEIALTRGEVEVPNVPYYGLIEGDVGYVVLTTFTRDAARNIRRAVSEMKAEYPQLKGILLDLRNNGGGLLNEAVDIVNIFVPKNEVVVSTRGKVKERDRVYRTSNNALDTEIPVAVLINKRSASASEIVSGALQDLDRAVLIGQRSYGKGLVQNVMDVGFNARVKITTAKYYIPSNRCIQSVEYANGEPLNIPDDQRAKFKTRAGRTVLDGGGVAPDIRIEKVTDQGVVKALIDEFILFDYVTEWALAHPAIDSVTNFRFTDWSDFLAYLDKREFTYESASEKLLLEALEKSKEEGLNVDKEIRALRAKIDATQQNVIEESREELIDILEKDIAARYYYAEGSTRMGLRNDEEIAEAIRILNNPQEYAKILR